MVQSLRIAFWMSEKKCQKINWVEFQQICQKYGFELIKVNFKIYFIYGIFLSQILVLIRS